MAKAKNKTPLPTPEVSAPPPAVIITPEPPVEEVAVAQPVEVTPPPVVFTPPVVIPPVVKFTPAAEPPSQRALLTFEMYCSMRQIPVRNRAGMRAYTKLQNAAVQDWDQAFLGY